MYLERNLVNIYDLRFLIEDIFLFQAVRKLWERFDGKNVSNGVMSSRGVQE